MPRRSVWRSSRSFSFGSNKMRAALSLFVFCVALSHAIVHEISFTVVPTTGYFSPIYEAHPPALFEVNSESASGPIFTTSFCDGRPSYENPITCSTYQVVVGVLGTQAFVSSDAMNITVIQSDIVQVTLGQTYTSLNETSYVFSADVPYIYTLTVPGSGTSFPYPVGFSSSINVAANVTLTTTGSLFPLYATTYPQTYSVELAGFYGSYFMYEGGTYYANAMICSSRDAVVLVDRSRSNPNFNSCYSYLNFGNGAYNATVISTETPATLNVSTSGNYTATCQTYGTSVDHYALVKLVNTDATSMGGFINSQNIYSQNASFDAVYNCYSKNSIDLSIVVNGPYTPISINASNEQLNVQTGFYQIDISAGIISGPFSNDRLIPRYGEQSCSTEKSFNYFGSISYGTFDLCYTVTENSTYDVPAINSAFVIQPPQGYCIRSDGIPSNSSNTVSLMSSESSTFFYEDDSTNLFTLTCSTDILHVQLDIHQPMTINFTLVPITGQGVYGKNYNVDGLLILQYPPLTASAGMFSVNVTESATALLPVPSSQMFFKRTVSSPFGFSSSSSSVQSNTSPLYQFIVMVRGQGQMTTDLGTSDGLNVGYDTTYSLYPSSTSTSSTESSSSTSSTSSEESTSSTDSTSSTSSDESTSSTSSTDSISSTFDSSTSSTTSETSSTVYEESTSSEDSSTTSPSTSAVSSTSSTSSVQSTSSTTSTSSTSSTTSTSSTVVSSSESEEDATNSSSADTTTSTSVSVTDTSVILTNNISSDSCMVKASVLSVVVMVLFSLY
ncbi:hypothetical protein PROFUN_09632 [Planoprotostelium fungivorum]|uniref:Uncharacterized protein n=1 Tax=Planoprotostelium fungivorum TaxID=1890364 RepID=A0A2P6MNZ5_9EUKA|nr:hypothetical protein PROFUN_09632 [Planoprotostelium fungivorum]